MPMASVYITVWPNDDLSAMEEQIKFEIYCREIVTSSLNEKKATPINPEDIYVTFYGPTQDPTHLTINTETFSKDCSMIDRVAKKIRKGLKVALKPLEISNVTIETRLIATSNEPADEKVESIRLSETIKNAIKNAEKKIQS